MSENGQDPFNRVGMIIFMGTMVVTCAFMIYVSFFEQGIQYDTIREKGKSSGIVASFDPSSVDNPWVSSAEMIKHGAKKYRSTCATCHGDTGMGNGPSAGGLVPPPRDLVEGKWAYGGDTIGLYKLIFDGSPKSKDMVAYGGMFPPGEIWAFVHYIQSITKNKKDTPAAQLEAFGKSQ